jgi:hypothetical protein
MKESIADLNKVAMSGGRHGIGKLGRQDWVESWKSVCCSAICHSSCWLSADEGFMGRILAVMAGVGTLQN